MNRRWLVASFGALGSRVGSSPRVSVGLFLLASALPALLGLWLGLPPRIGLDEGFMPANAPSKREISAQKKFFFQTDKSREWYMALFGFALPQATNGSVGNMLEPSNYNTFNAFYERVFTQINISGIGWNNSFSQICHPFCEINEQFRKLMEYSSSWLAAIGQVKMGYPISRVLSYDVNIGKHVLNRKIDSKGNLVGAEVLAFYFTTFIQDEQSAKALRHFEEKVAAEAQAENAKQNRVRLMVHGSSGVEKEMRRGVLNAARNALIAISLGILVFIALHGFSAWLHSQFVYRRLAIAAACILVLGQGMCAAFAGFQSLLGMPVNLLHFSTPLVYAALLFTGHGTLQLADLWCNLLGESMRKQYTASERLARAFEQIGPSLLQLHLWQVVAFALLSIVLPAQHYRSLCLGMALLFAYCLLLQFFFFAPLLAHFCHLQVDERFRFVNGSPPAVLLLGPNEATKTTTKTTSVKTITAKSSPPPPTKAEKPSISSHPPIIQLRSKQEHKLIPAASTSAPKNLRLLARKGAGRKATRRKQIRLAGERAITLLANFLDCSIGRFLVSLLTAFLFSLALWRGIPSLRNNMDYRRMLPGKSPAIVGFDAMDAIWADFLQIVFIVQRPPDFEDAEQFGLFKEFLHSVTTLPQALPPQSHMSWLFDYYKDKLGKDFFLHLTTTTNTTTTKTKIENEEKTKRTKTLNKQTSTNFNFNSSSPPNSSLLGKNKKPEEIPQADTLNTSKFEEFINGFPYSAWKNGVRYSFIHNAERNQSRVSIWRMLILLAYRDTHGLAGKRQLINKCRAVARRFPQFWVSVFDTDLRTTDIMDTMEPVLMRSLVVIFAVSLVCISALSEWHFAFSALVFLTGVSSFTLFFGLGQLLGLELDLLTVPSAILLAVLSAQFASQFLRELLLAWAKEAPIRRALRLSAFALAKLLPIWLSLCVPPLLLSQVPFFGLQAALLLLSCALAYFHSLVLLPALASLAPKSWLI